ncbi:MAG: hypothetical protein IBJ02_07045 [Brevundimonas sp.]|nr:hypothetical protein [Brevundimonas sp.]
MTLRFILAALALSLCAPGPVAAQAEPRVAIISINQTPEVAVDGYVRAFDRMLAEVAAEGGLPAPSSTEAEVRSMAASVVSEAATLERSHKVNFGVSVAVGRFGDPGVGDRPGRTHDTTEDECRARYPDATAFDVRVARFGAVTAYQCLRLETTEGKRSLAGIATVSMPDRIIVTAISLNAEGAEAGLSDGFAAPEAAARLLFDGQVDAAVLRLTLPSER